MLPDSSREEPASWGRSDPLLHWGLAFLAFALPLVLFPGGTDFYTIPKTLLLHVVVLIGLLRVAGPGRNDKTCISITSLSLPLLAMLGVGLVSLVGARFPWAGVEAAWRLWNGIVLYHLAVVAFSFVPARRHFLVAIGLSILPVAAYGILQVMGIDFLRLARPGVPVSSLGNTGFVAEYLVAALPIALGLAVKEGHGYLFAPCVMLGILHLWLTESRAGWLSTALAFGILVLSPWSVFRSGEARLRLRRLGLVTLLVVLTLAFLAPDLGSTSLARLRSIIDPTQATARVRLLIWRGALDLVARHPLLGVGLGNFEFAYAEVRSVEEWHLSRREVVDDAHNEYLHLTVETGLVGLGVFLWFLTRAARLVRNLLRSATLREQALPLIGSLAGLLLYAGFGFPFKNPTSSAYWWMLLGYLSALDLKTDRHTSPTLHLLWVRASAMLHAALAVLLVFGSFLADLHLRRVQVSSRAGKDAEADAEYQSALRLYPPLVWTHRLRSLVHDDRRMFPLLASEYERQLRSQPNDAWLLAKLGGLYGALGRQDEAKALLQRAIALRPSLPSAHENLGSALLLSGDVQGAVSELGLAVQLDPRNGRLRYKLAVAMYAAGQKVEAERQFRIAKNLDPVLPDFLKESKR